MKRPSVGPNFAVHLALCALASVCFDVAVLISVIWLGLRECWTLSKKDEKSYCQTEDQ